MARRTCLVREALDTRIRDGGDERVDALVRIVRHSSGAIAMGDLADRIGFSERQLERLFLNAVGLRPKLFARIVRLHRAVRRIADRHAENLAEIAAECGYSDQAHFGRDFLDLGRLPPSPYVQLSRSLQLSLAGDTLKMSDLF